MSAPVIVPSRMSALVMVPSMISELPTESAARSSAGDALVGDHAAAAAGHGGVGELGRADRVGRQVRAHVSESFLTLPE